MICAVYPSPEGQGLRVISGGEARRRTFWGVGEMCSELGLEHFMAPWFLFTPLPLLANMIPVPKLENTKTLFLYGESPDKND